MKYTIDESYICDVSIREEWSTLENPENPTPDDLIKIIKGYAKVISTRTCDHDEFTKLRNQLELDGYIKTESGWWNGDRVLKSFSLNEWKFKKGSKFPCAAAMKSHIQYARSIGRKTLAIF